LGEQSAFAAPLSSIAARLGGCHELLSEDLSDGQDFGGVTVRNPFRA
jgi:predicted nucleic acid-binding protein